MLSIVLQLIKKKSYCAHLAIPENSIGQRTCSAYCGGMNAFGRWQHWLARRAVRRNFAAVYCHGLENISGIPLGTPVILAPIHTGWWDGFFCSCLLPRLPGRRFFLAQHAQHLGRYPWFRHAGVIGLDARGAGRLRAGLRQLESCLCTPGALLVYFPQGRLTIQDADPIEARRGLGFFAGAAGSLLVPLVWRHGLRDGPKPELWMRIGEPIRVSGLPANKAWNAAMATLESDLRRDWNNSQLTHYQALSKQKPAIHAKWVNWSKRWLGRADPVENGGDSA
ncbi:MAG: lysophospholipid acyltransferase family protein [Verrucomicrobiales bacterium]